MQYQVPSNLSHPTHMVRMTVEWGENWDLSSINAVDRQIMEVSIDSSLKTQLSASGKSDLTIDDRILLPMDGGASTIVSSLLADVVEFSN